MAMASAAGVHPSSRHDILPTEDTLCIVVKNAEHAIQIEVPREVELRYVQRLLCKAFKERFPLMCASLSDSEGRFFDEFSDRPFKCAEPNDVYEIAFALTRDMFWFDWIDRREAPTCSTPCSVRELPPLSLD